MQVHKYLKFIFPKCAPLYPTCLPVSKASKMLIEKLLLRGTNGGHGATPWHLDQGGTIVKALRLLPRRGPRDQGRVVVATRDLRPVAFRLTLMGLERGARYAARTHSVKTKSIVRHSDIQADHLQLKQPQESYQQRSQTPSLKMNLSLSLI